MEQSIDYAIGHRVRAALRGAGATGSCYGASPRRGPCHAGANHPPSRSQRLDRRRPKGRRMERIPRQALRWKRAIVRFARDGRGKYRAPRKIRCKLSCDWLNAGQRAAVEHILGSHDGIMIVSGSAWRGQNTLLKEAVEGIEENGTKVFAFGPRRKRAAASSLKRVSRTLKPSRNYSRISGSRAVARGQCFGSMRPACLVLGLRPNYSTWPSSSTAGYC